MNALSVPVSILNPKQRASLLGKKLVQELASLTEYLPYVELFIFSKGTIVFRKELTKYAQALEDVAETVSGNVRYTESKTKSEKLYALRSQLLKTSILAKAISGIHKIQNLLQLAGLASEVPLRNVLSRQSTDLVFEQTELKKLIATLGVKNVHALTSEKSMWIRTVTPDTTITSFNAADDMHVKMLVSRKTKDEQKLFAYLSFDIGRVAGVSCDQSYPMRDYVFTEIKVEPHEEGDRYPKCIVTGVVEFKKPIYKPGSWSSCGGGPVFVGDGFQDAKTSWPFTIETSLVSIEELHERINKKD